MHGLTGGEFVWKKRRGGLGAVRDTASLERRRAELLEIQERRKRQEEIRQNRLIAREEAHVQDSESHALEVDFQARVFEYQTLRKKGSTKSSEQTFASAIHNLSRSFASEIYDQPLSGDKLWKPKAHWITLIGEAPISDLKAEVELANVFLENLLQIIELKQKSEKLAAMTFEQNVIDDEDVTLCRPGTVKQLESEIEFWMKLKTALVGEMRERLDKEESLAELTIVELRQTVQSMSTKDVWDLGRLISLQLYYAADDDRIDVDFWESLELRYAWISAVVWLAEIAKKQNGSTVDVVNYSSQEDGCPESDVAEIKQATAQLVEKELANNNIVVPKFSVDVEDPNEVFDRLVLRETAQEAADSQNIIKGGEFETWLGGPGRDPALVQPVKPRYFNRIKVAHEWHKYNQVHYDIDNPPPKSVQGYKFMLCYPNLAQQHKPTWKLMEDHGAEDASTVLIRFSAPTYEDVAFRIIRREWDLTPRNGYKNTYEAGIFILSFMLKRNRYRK